MAAKKTEKKSRVQVSLQDFLRVTIAERDKFPTLEDAAKALGMTEGSFQQRLMRERKAYPRVFEAVPSYKGSRGPKRVTEDEALAMLAKLQGATSDGEDDAQTGSAS